MIGVAVSPTASGRSKSMRATGFPSLILSASLLFAACGEDPFDAEPLLTPSEAEAFATRLFQFTNYTAFAGLVYSQWPGPPPIPVTPALDWEFEKLLVVRSSRRHRLRDLDRGCESVPHRLRDGLDAGGLRSGGYGISAPLHAGWSAELDLRMDLSHLRRPYGGRRRRRRPRRGVRRAERILRDRSCLRGYVRPRATRDLWSAPPRCRARSVKSA